VVWMSTTKLNVVSVVDFNKIKSEVNRLFTPTATHGWVLVRYTAPTTIAFQESSDQNVNSLVSKLHDDQVQYALIRLSASLNPDGVSKDVFLTWAGPKVGKIERGKKSEHLADVKSILGPSHIDLTALTKQNFTEAKLWELSDPSAGSHVLKPSDHEERSASQVDEQLRKATEEKLRKQTEEKKQKLISPRAAGGASASGPAEKLSVVSVVNIDQIRTSVKTLLERDTIKGWVLVRYTGQTQISFQESGFGPLSELAALLEENQMQYALIRLPPDPISKDIFLSWVGPKVSKIEQGKKSEHLADLKSLLGPAHGSITAFTKQNFTETKIRELADPSSGTHILKEN